MQAIMETLFDIVYLVTVITIGIKIPDGGLLSWAVYGVTVLVRVLSVGI